MRRSQRVALVLLGTAGVVGAATLWDVWRTTAAENSAAVLPEAEPVTTDRVYANNEYVPGAGYYHAPYHAWFPYPFNHHDPARGYFAGGLWQAAPFVASMMQSQPSSAAVSSAVAAQQAQREKQLSPARSGFSGGGYRSSGFSSPRTAPAPGSRPSIIRGGFGSSAHPAGS